MEATKRLAKGIRILLEELQEEESKSYGGMLGTLDFRSFRSIDA
jgi:hypothetical protein